MNTPTHHGANAMKRIRLLALLVLASVLGAFAQTPSVTGFSSTEKPFVDKSFVENQTLFLNLTRGIKVSYDAAVSSTQWSLLQGGNVVLSGSDTQSKAGENYNVIDMYSSLLAALQNGSAALGETTLNIDKITYGDGQEAANVGSISLNLSDAPYITQYYPSSEQPASEIRAGITVWMYFSTGAKIIGSNAEVIQNDEVLGTVEFSGNGTGTTVSLDKNLVSAAMERLNVAAGLVTFKPIDVTYISPIDGSQKVYASADGEFAPVTYAYNGTPGKVASETEFPFHTVYSWYDPASQDGQKSITFSKPVGRDIAVFLEYGNMENVNNYCRRNVPYTLSEDGLTLTLDLRGMLNSVNNMVPRAHFVDDNGNPVAPPTEIVIGLEGLYCTDGTPIVGEMHNFITGDVMELVARLHYVYHYSDLSFDTPKITNVTLSDTQAVLTVRNAANIKSANVAFIGVSDDLAYAPASISGESITCDIPEGLVIADVVAVGLKDVVFTSVDGDEHVIAPYTLSGKSEIPEAASVADVKNLEVGGTYIFNASDLKVTMSFEDFVFVEDATGALQIDPYSSPALLSNTVINGKLSGQYLGGNMYSFSADKSEYTVDPATITPTVMDVTEALYPENNCRYAKFVASDDVKIYYSEDYECFVVEAADGAMLMVPTEIIAGLDNLEYKNLDAISAISGVIYTMAGSPTTMLLVDDTSKIETGAAPIEGISIAQAKELQPGEISMVAVNDAKITFVMQETMAFVEDESGAIQVAWYEEDAPADPLMQGTAITGTLALTAIGNGLFFIDYTSSDFTAKEADIAFGTRMTAAEAMTRENANRLATFYSSDNEIVFDQESGMVIIDNVLYGMDLEMALAEYDINGEIRSVTGLIYPTMGSPMEEEFDETQYMLLIRDIYDIDAAISAKPITLGEAKDLDESMSCVVAVDGAKVTFVMQDSMAFIEDETGAIQVAWYDEVPPFTQGTAITGKLSLISWGGGVFIYDSFSSNVTSVEADVKYGTPMTAAQAMTWENANRLVTFDSTDNEIVFDEDLGMIAIDGILFGVDLEMQLEGHVFEGEIQKVTGLMYPTAAMMDADSNQQYMLLIRDLNDIEEKSTGIEAINADSVSSDVYSVSGMKVRSARESMQNLPKGVYIIGGKKVYVK